MTAKTRLRPPTRKFWLLMHIVSAGAWFGVDIIVAVLVSAGDLGASKELRGLAYQALGTFVWWPMFTCGLLCLISGLVLGWGTRWGLLIHWWVTVKLVVNVALCTLILLALRPSMPVVTEYGVSVSAGRPAEIDENSLIFPPIVSLSLLSMTMVLSVFKPWGRISRSPRPTRSIAQGRTTS